MIIIEDVMSPQADSINNIKANEDKSDCQGDKAAADADDEVDLSVDFSDIVL